MGKRDGNRLAHVRMSAASTKLDGRRFHGRKGLILWPEHDLASLGTAIRMREDGIKPRYGGHQDV